MFRMSWCVLSVALGTLGAGAADAAAPSHKQVQVIRVEKAGGATLQTLSLTPDGNLAALLAPPRYGDEESLKKKAAQTSEVRLLNADGGELARWRVEFKAQSIGVGPDGAIFVGGDGRIAKYDAGGTLLTTVELPHLKEVLGDSQKLRERALERQKSMEASQAASRRQFERQKEQYQQQIDKLNSKPDKELTAAEKRRLKRFTEQLEQLASMELRFQTPSLDEMIKEVTDRVRIVNGVTATAQDLFVVTGETSGYGYAVWRMDHQFARSRQVLSGLRGCCGQMDVQAQGDELFVAENCGHCVGKYTRDGEKIKSLGKKSQVPEAEGEGLLSLLASRRKKAAESGDAAEQKDECFGGCCNPMNVRIGRDGRVYTSESEGIIRCFSPEGEHLAVVARAKLAGGCKNVAIAVSPDGSRVYLCDQPGQRIIVLERDPSEAAAETAQK